MTTKIDRIWRPSRLIVFVVGRDDPVSLVYAKRYVPT